MFLLIAGLILWSLAHFFKRAMPERRAAMGEAGKGAVTVALILALIAMVLGYRWAEFIPIWYPPAFLVHVNNLLMLIAVFVFGMSATTGRLRGKMRHPQLTAVKIWAFAHLLVNGDLASVVLFGGLFAWAVTEVVVINRSDAWERPAPGTAKKDVVLVVITLVAFAAMTAVHAMLGVWPFPG